MTHHFSKLNNIGSNFCARGKKTDFTMGFNKKETSSDSDEDIDIQEATPVSSYELKKNPIEKGKEATENYVNEHNFTDVLISETFLPGVGIVMGSNSENVAIPCDAKLKDKHNLLRREDSSQVDDVQLSSIMDNVTIQISNNPKISINLDGVELIQTPCSLSLAKKISHSSGEVDGHEHEGQNDIINAESCQTCSNSDCNFVMNISQSQSESALKSKLTSLTSPVTTKELVFSPFSKLAKGVQNFGANLDPRKLSNQSRQIGEKELDERQLLQEKWKNSKTRLVAL